MQEQDDLEAQDDFTAKRIVYAIPAMEDAVVQKKAIPGNREHLAWNSLKLAFIAPMLPRSIL